MSYIIPEFSCEEDAQEYADKNGFLLFYHCSDKEVVEIHEGDLSIHSKFMDVTMSGVWAAITPRDDYGDITHEVWVHKDLKTTSPARFDFYSIDDEEKQFIIDAVSERFSLDEDEIDIDEELSILGQENEWQEKIDNDDSWFYQGVAAEVIRRSGYDMMRDDDGVLIFCSTDHLIRQCAYY